MVTANQNMDKTEYGDGEAQLNKTLLLKVTMDMVPKLLKALTGPAVGDSERLKWDKFSVTSSF